MKFLDEYRDKEQVVSLIHEIGASVTRDWHIMEICGGQTHSLVKNGILELLPDSVEMIHGPGCPVCVTPVRMIDKAVQIAARPEVIFCTFGDMMRVPGTEKSLLKAKAEGADVRMVYSPLDALKLALTNPDKEVVFFAVGFETTAPANALSVIQASRKGIINYSILTSHVLVPPAMQAILEDEETVIDGFLAAGHVCTVMGTDEYQPVVNNFKVPVVVTGFEPVDLLKGILGCVKQLEDKEYRLDNQYSRVVKKGGNEQAKAIIFEVFEIADREWRGIGTIPDSGYALKQEYALYDAVSRFQIAVEEAVVEQECIAGQILKGIKKPTQCPHFGKRCTPTNPLGAPMVSSEGACAAYYHYGYEPVND